MQKKVFIISNKEFSFEEKLFLFYYPIINALFFSTINFFPNNSSVIIFRGLFSFVIIMYFIKNIQLAYIDMPSKILIAFSIYILFMGGVTYARYGQFDVKVLKVFIASFFYLFSFRYVYNIKTFLLMIKSILISLFIVITIIIILNLLDIEGTQNYGINYNFGAQGVNTIKILPIFTLILLYFLINFKTNLITKLFIFILIITSVILVFLAMKRGALLGLLFSIFIYLLFNHRKVNITKYILILILIFSPFSKNITNQIEESYSLRENRFHFVSIIENEEEEARINETHMVLSDIPNRSPLNIFFGEGISSEYFYFSTSRMLHTDYMSILHGGGIIGLFLYLYFFYVIFLKLFKMKVNKYIKDYYIFFIETRLIIFSILIINLFLAISGSYHIIELRGFILYFVGGAMAIIERFKFIPFTTTSIHLTSS